MSDTPYRADGGIGAMRWPPVSTSRRAPLGARVRIAISAIGMADAL